MILLTASMKDIVYYISSIGINQPLLSNMFSLFACWVILYALLLSADLFKVFLFQKNPSFRNAIKLSLTNFLAFLQIVIVQIRTEDKNFTRPLVIQVKSRKDEQFFPKHLSYRKSALGQITQGSHIAYYSLMIFIAYDFKGHVYVFAG